MAYIAGGGGCTLFHDFKANNVSTYGQLKKNVPKRDILSKISNLIFKHSFGVTVM